MPQLPKAKTQPTKWVIQAYTLSSQQQTTKICATLKFEAKSQLGDRTTVSPQDFEKLNNLISDYCLSNSREIIERCCFLGLSGLSAIAFLQCGGVQ